MKRRDVLRGAALGAATLPAAAQHHTAAAKKPAAAATVAARKRLLFDDHQLETVATLCDLIIPATDTPGARQARVHDFVDLLLKDGPTDRRNRFLAGLGWLDGYAIRQHGQPFVKCGAASQTAMLKTLDGATSSALRSGAAFFREIKQLTVMGYYTSREGIAELNKGGRVPGSFSCKSTGGREA